MKRRETGVRRFAEAAWIVGALSCGGGTTTSREPLAGGGANAAERASSSDVRAPPRGRPEPPASEPSPGGATGPAIERGYASWYGNALAGHKTASGERFDPRALTAAHRTLPLGTWVEVRRVGDGREHASVRVRINDRGPTAKKLVIDLSRHAAEVLGIVQMGIAPVELRVIRGP